MSKHRAPFCSHLRLSLFAHVFSQIGWSRDGPSIFGRYLYTSSLGYSTAIDACGGHDHDGLGYQ